MRSGSPPRVRGKEVSRRLGLAVDGITPACAGKSSTATLAAHSTGDHPRVCGEKPQPATHSAAPPGSPPRMRGKDEQTTGKNENARITPAYAGKRSQGVAALQLGWDHPRVCGEKQSRQRCWMSRTGSPPRMRGKDHPPAYFSIFRGITPAYAGKSPPQARMPGLCRDHPRVCGEKYDAPP